MQQSALCSKNDIELKLSTVPVYLDVVEGLRGIAALVVVIYHCFTNSGLPEWRPFFKINVLRMFHDGWCGVNLFLVLSGFCLFWPFARNEARTLCMQGFIRKRMRRIIPAYYASLAIVPLIYWIPTQLGLPTQVKPTSGSIPFMPNGGADVAFHLLLLHSFSAEAFRSWNGVAWSLGLEWTWYLFFPVAVWMFRKWGAYRTVLLCSVVTVGYCCALYWTMGSTKFLEENLAFAARNMLPARLLEFSLGMLAASWIANHRTTSRLTALAVLSIIPVLALAHLTTPVDPVFPVRNTLYGIASLLMLLATVSSTPNPMVWICRLTWLQKIGQWSYSLYLFHLPVIVLVTNALAASGVNGPVRFFMSLLSLPFIIIMAKWEYLAFERPFLATKQIHNHLGNTVPLPSQQSS